MAKGARGGKRGINNPNASKDNWSNSSLGYKIGENLQEALGAKGQAMKPSEAWFDANPYYSDDYAEFSQNCQRCVFAYEMRRRGYDVTALPTYKGDNMPVNGAWMNAMSGMERVMIGKSTEKATMNNIEKQMKTWGEGSRGIIRLRWAGGGGHVINCEYSNGHLQVYDVQSNKRVTGKEYLKTYLPFTTLSKTEILRTDNATPTDDMRFMVKAK